MTKRKSEVFSIGMLFQNVNHSKNVAMLQEIFSFFFHFWLRVGHTNINICNKNTKKKLFYALTCSIQLLDYTEYFTHFTLTCNPYLHCPWYMQTASSTQPAQTWVSQAIERQFHPPRSRGRTRNYFRGRTFLCCRRKRQWKRGWWRRTSKSGWWSVVGQNFHYS